MNLKYHVKILIVLILILVFSLLTGNALRAQDNVISVDRDIVLTKILTESTRFDFDESKGKFGFVTDTTIKIIAPAYNTTELGVDKHEELVIMYELAHTKISKDGVEVREIESTFCSGMECNVFYLDKDSKNIGLQVSIVRFTKDNNNYPRYDNKYRMIILQYNWDYYSDSVDWRTNPRLFKKSN